MVNTKGPVLAEQIPLRWMEMLISSFLRVLYWPPWWILEKNTQNQLAKTVDAFLEF